MTRWWQSAACLPRCAGVGLAARRADVIRELAVQRVVGLEAADAAATRLGVSRRQVYVLVGRWRAGEGLASDLLPGISSGGPGGGRLP